MKQDNTFSSLIRPSLMLWLTVLFSTLMIVDGNFFEITIKECYITVLESILMVVYGAYFIGKSYEHGARISKGEPTEIEGEK